MSKRRAKTRRDLPISVPFPPSLRRRAARFAKANNIALATAIRLLVTERLDDIADSEQLSRAEQWQQAQAWATWEGVRSGAVRSVPRDRIAQVFADAKTKRR